MWKSLVAIIAIISGIKFTAADCTLDNVKFYPEGAFWNPVDGQQIGAGCVNCTCKDNKVSCKNVDCPILTCDTPRYPVGACCPICEMKPDKDGSDGAHERPCKLEGKTYKHNEFFPNNNTAIRPYRRNQCVDCVCQDGTVYCFLKTCPKRRRCSLLQKSTDSCCPVCLDKKVDRKDKKKEDCSDSEGYLQRNASTWHPEVAGKVEKCITCTCKNGKVECKRTCQSKEDCDKVVCPKLKKGCRIRRKKGKCCPVCSKPKKGICGKSRRKGRKGKKRRGNKRKNKRRGKKRNRKRRKHRKMSTICVKRTTSQANNNSCPKLFPPIKSTDLPCFIQGACLPQKTNFIIYRRLIGNDTAFIAFDDVTANKIEIWKWTVRKDKIKKTEKYNCDSNSFRVQLQSSGTILGAATSRSVKDFKRKLSRGFRGCERKKKGCRLRTVRRQLLCFELVDMPLKKCRKTA